MRPLNSSHRCPHLPKKAPGPRSSGPRLHGIAAIQRRSRWRTRLTPFLVGRDEIRDFLTQKWARETQYALRKDLWTFAGNRIAVRFQYESLDVDGQWWRSYGNENWEFDDAGLMRRREASINDVAITEAERRLFGPRPDGDRSVIPLQ